MKWTFLMLLLLNLVYLGWEIDRETKFALNNSALPLKVPKSARYLVLINEMDTSPEYIKNKKSNSERFDLAPGETEIDGEETNFLNTQQQTYADVSIERDDDIDLLTKMPDIIAPDMPGILQQKHDSLCFSYGPFTENEQAINLMEWFTDRDIQANKRDESDGGKQLFWIYLAPQDTKQDALAAVEELKNRGIKDHRVIQTGDLQNAISLGLFSTQVAVNRRLNELKNIGSQPIVVPYREANSIYWLDVKITDQQDILNEILSSEPSRFNFVPVKCTEIALL